MQVMEIEYSQLRTLKEGSQFSNEKIGVRVSLNADESPSHAIERAKAFVSRYFDKDTEQDF